MKSGDRFWILIPQGRSSHQAVQCGIINVYDSSCLVNLPVGGVGPNVWRGIDVTVSKRRLFKTRGGALASRIGN